MELCLVDGDTGETLDAALAYIADEYVNDLARRNTESGPSSPDAFEYSQEIVHDACGKLTLPSLVACVTPRATKNIRERRKGTTKGRTSATGSRRNRSRDRQRLEILQLRAEAEVLEDRINEIRDKQHKRGQDSTGWIMNSSDKRKAGISQLYQGSRCGSQLFDAWKDLANRHRKLRKDSETDNRNLRDIYSTQLTTIEMLKKLLQNHEKMKRSVYSASQYYVQSCFDADDSALVVIDRLNNTLDSLYVDTDRVLCSNGLATVTSTFTQTNMNQSTETVTNIEILNCRVIPFDLKALGEAFWYEMTKNYVANEVERGQSPKSAKENTIQQAFTMTLDDDSIEAKIQFRYAGSRKNEQNREVIALLGQSQVLQAFGMTIQGVHVQEKSWLVLSELIPSVTVVKVCMGMSIQFDCEVPNRQQFIDRLCGILVRVKQLGFESVLQGVEHSLLVV